MYETSGRKGYKRGAELPPCISIVRYPARPVMLGTDFGLGAKGLFEIVCALFLSPNVVHSLNHCAPLVASLQLAPSAYFACSPENFCGLFL